MKIVIFDYLDVLKKKNYSKLQFHKSISLIDGSILDNMKVVLDSASNEFGDGTDMVFLF